MKNCFCGIAFLAVLFTGLGQGKPFGPAIAAIERMQNDAQSSTPRIRKLALDSLKVFIEGRPENIEAGYARSLGLEGMDFTGIENWSERAIAATSLGATGLPEAFDYLTSLKVTDLGKEFHSTWAAAQNALRSMQLERIREPQLKVEFLERLATDWSDSNSASRVQSWAVDQLCDTGVLLSLSVIQQSIRGRATESEANEEIGFCEARIRIVRSDANRTQALASFLKNERNPQAERLLKWAAYQLSLIRDAGAAKAIDALADDLDKYPTSSPEWRRFRSLREDIQHYRDTRGKLP